MKTKYTLAFALLLNVNLSLGQSIVTSGLNLHLDASVGFNSNGISAATWNDQSGAGNHLAAPSNAAEPSLVANAAGTPFQGVYFDGTNDYMYRVLGNNFDSAAATLFVVRIGNTSLNTTDSVAFSKAATTLSIASQGSFNEEFVLFGDWALHHTSSGSWVRRSHQCYYQLPDTLPVVANCVFNTGTTSADLTYKINGVTSTYGMSYQSTPNSYTTLPRSIILGARFTNSYSVQNVTRFPGYILEVLAYNRALSAVEADSVNEYLKCKYAVNYASCNSIISCPVLPINLLTFNASMDKNDGKLNWTVASSPERIKYTIQRSNDAKNFQNIYEVTSNKQEHLFTDINVGTTHPKVYYRLMSVDQSNTASYSKIRSLDFSKKSEITVFPNVVHNSENINISTSANFENMQVQLFDLTGRLLMTDENRTNGPKTHYAFNIHDRIPPGIYLLKISIDDNVSYHKIEVQ